MMGTRMDGWNIPNKEAFVEYLLKETHARFYPAKAEGRITNDEYWALWDDLYSMAVKYLDVEVKRKEKID